MKLSIQTSRGQLLQSYHTKPSQERIPEDKKGQLKMVKNHSISNLNFKTEAKELRDFVARRPYLLKNFTRPQTSKQQNIKTAPDEQQDQKKPQIQLIQQQLLQSQVQVSLQPKYYIGEVVKAHVGLETYFNRLFKDHFNSCFYILKAFDQSVISLKAKPITLPKDVKQKYTLLFDLDETLIHANLNLHMPCDKRLMISISQWETLNVGLNVRPGLQQMLDTLNNHFELIIFTASHSAYARKVVEYIDPKRYFKQILSREHCSQNSQGQYIKDLSLIKNRALSHVLLIDNSAFSYALQLDNGVPILPYYDNKGDRQLQSLTKYLLTLIPSHDLRIQNRHQLKNHILQQAATPVEALDQIK